VGCVFLCISGTTVDAHDFIPQVAEKGAAAIVVTKDVQVPANVTVVKVENARKALSYMAAAYFGKPAEKMTLIGITGTKGKTTTSYMVQAMLEMAGKKVGVIGTIGAVIDKGIVKTSNTTPESYEVQRLFAKMVEAGCEYCIMEVSSQGMKMDRVAGVLFDYGIFTNFSSDHIGPNEHADMAEYLYCKSLLFRQCKVGIINRDSEYWQGVTEGHTCELKTYGFDADADLRGANQKLVRKSGVLGVEFDVEGVLNCHVKTCIPGRFSVYNCLTALAIGWHLDIPIEAMTHALKNIRVPGRVELVDISPKFTIMVDYAHNAMSVESLLTTIKEYNPNRIICVYGLGGNRSKVRRYEVGELCGKMADLSVLTADNPRNEEIADIFNDIKIGLAKTNGKYIEIPDRKEAIYYAIDHAQENDIIVVFGKGHEDYQEIKGVRYPYNDKEAILSYLKREMNFVKLHGCGNPYIYMDVRGKNYENAFLQALSIKVSDKSKGIGADGLIVLDDAQTEGTDGRMRMFNADGSEGAMCGNGIRCLAKFMYEHAGIEKEHMVIETKSGLREVDLIHEGDEITKATVYMGHPEFEAANVPVISEHPVFMDGELPVELESGVKYCGTCMSMGNPHCVIFTEDIDALELAKIGPKFECHEMFPERVNTEFIEIVDRNNVRMRVWERGSGETMACGTGACAVVAAGVRTGRLSNKVNVMMRGGTLEITYDVENNDIYMTGEAVQICVGKLRV